MKAFLLKILFVLSIIFTSSVVNAQVTIDSAVTTDVACNGDSSGTAHIYITAANGPFEYDLSGPIAQTVVTGTDNLFTNLPAGLYVCVVTENSGAGPFFDVVLININEPTALDVSGTITHVLCSGGSTGSIDVTVADGTPPYTHSWAPGGSTGEDTSGIGAGTYTITVTDSLGCQDTAIFNVNEGAPIIPTISLQHITCFGDDDGVVGVTGVSGGTPGYMYQIDGGGFGMIPVFSSLTPGAHTLSVRDANLCQTDSVVTIIEPPVLDATGIVTNVSCFGGNDGAIDVSVVGGRTPYTYSWNPGGSTGQDTSGINAGPYDVTVTDSSGCTHNEPFVVTEPNALNIGGVITPVSCFGGSDGAIDVTVTDGTSPYTYSWNPGGSTGQDTTGLDSNIYVVTVTDSNGCVDSATFTVTQPDSMTITAVVSDPSCNGGSDGTIDVTVIDGTAPYIDYTWTPGLSKGQDTLTVGAGNYQIQVTDNNNCIQTAQFTVNEPAPIVPTLDITHITCFGNNNGTVVVSSVAGGTPGFEYAIDGGGFGTSNGFGALTPGPHTVSVRDTNLCQKDSIITILEPPVLSATAVITHVSCPGGSDGAIDVTPTGGAPPYTTLWTPGFSLGEDTSGVDAQMYFYNLQDTNGCTFLDNYLVTEPVAMIIAGNVTNVSCFGGSDGAIDVTVTNGTTPYTYSWTPGGSTGQDTMGLDSNIYQIVVTDSAGCQDSASFTVTQPDSMTITGVVTNVSCFGGSDGAIDVTVTGGTPGPGYTYNWPSGGSTGEDTSGVNAGNYQIDVTDSASCMQSATFTVTEPDSISITAVITPVSCFGGTDGAIDVSVTDGTPPYTYIWAAGGNTGQDTSGVPIGSYMVTVTDSLGCTNNATFTMTQPDSMTITAAITPVTCFGGNDGAIDVTVINGTGPYIDYTWTPGLSKGQDTTGVDSGVYQIQVTDFNSCIQTATFTVTEADSIDITAVITPASCSGGSDGAIDISMTGGNPPYVGFSWAHGPGTEDVSGLATGTYTVTVTDNSGCMQTDSFFVPENIPIIIADSVTHVSCFGGNDGAIDISISGGTMPYDTIQWSHGPTTEDVNSLVADTFVVRVVDNAGCVNSDTFVVTQPLGMNITGVITPPLCVGDSNAAIDVTVIGGVTPYQDYTWNPGGTKTEDTTGINAGLYILTVIDSNGCPQTDSFTVSDPTPLTTTSVIAPPTCDGGNNGSIDVTPAGGTGTFSSYLWAPGGSTGQDTVGVDSGQYILTFEDGNGCAGTDTFNVTDPTPVTATAVITLASCNGGSDGAIDLTPAGGTAPYTFAWLPGGATSEDISGLAADTFSVTITDSLGCIGLDTFIVSENTPIIIGDSVTHILCNGQSTGAIDVSVSGGVTPYVFDWNGGFAATEDLNAIPAGTYIITVTDSVNCVSVDSFTVNEPLPIVVNDSITHIVCGGSNTGAIDITVSGGTTPYGYVWTQGGTTAEDTTGLSTGNYDVTVTDSNGCMQNQPFTVNENPPLGMTFTTSPTCAGDSIGAIDITVTGGVTPYVFNWNSGFASTEDLDSIPGGQYIVQITDSVGCALEDTVNLVADPKPTGVLVSDMDTVCYGDVFTVTATLDNPPFFPNAGGSYSFDNGASFSATNQVMSAPVVAGDTMVIVTYRDAIGCLSDNDTVNIHVLTPITATLDTLVFPTCTGPPGEMRLHNISGGLPPYTVSLNGGPSVATSDTTYTNLLPGLYTVLVTDDNGCTWTQSINFLSSITATIDTTNPTCFGSCDGTIALSNVTGGVAPYQFSLNDTVADPFSLADSIFTPLCAGNYDIYIKDSTGCIAILNVNLNQPDSVQILELGKVDESCNGFMDGELTVSAIGGNGDYTFTFNTTMVAGAGPHIFTNLAAGTDTVFVVDSSGCSDDHIFTIAPSDSLQVFVNEQLASSGCNLTDGIGNVDSVLGGSGSYQYSINGGVSFQDTTLFPNLLSGSYLLITRDKILGCEDTTRFAISSPIGIDLDSIDGTVIDPSCVTNDGSISLTNIQGGTAPFSFSLTGPVSAGAQFDSTFTGLTQGFYFATISDNGGCDQDYYFFVGAPTPLILLVTPTPETCANQDGSLNISISGGTMPYILNVNDGGTFNLDTTLSSTSLLLSNLSGGTYNVTLSDSSNPSCTDFLSVTITSTRNDAVLDRDTVTCPWSTDGELNITLTDNATHTFAFSIDDTLSFDTARTYTNITPGVHQLWIKQYETATGDSCVYADFETYYYVPWADTLLGVLYDSTSYPSMLSDTALHDTFTVSNFIIFAPDSMTASFTNTNADKHENNGTSLIHGLTGGTPGYQYSYFDTISWTAYNLADTTVNLVQNLADSTYTVYVEDSNGCRQEFTTTIDVNLFIPNIYTPNDDGDNDFFEICGLTEDAELRVYNRWGSLVYHHGKYDNTWNGAKLADGTYFWELKTVSGQSYNGWVQILR